MQVTVSPKAILQAIEFLKEMCEEYGEGFPLDPKNFYQHVGALLANDPAPELVPAKVVEVRIESMSGMLVAVGPPGVDPEQLDAMLQLIGTPESFQVAAEWGFIFYRDFFGEDPSTGHEDGYMLLTTAAHGLLSTRLARIAMHSSPLS